MPAVSLCDPASVALRNSLESSQHKSSDELSNSLVSSASQILQSEISYEETDNYQTMILDKLQAKYVLLSLPTSGDVQTNHHKDDQICTKNNETKTKGKPSLPEPSTVLYSPSRITLGWKKQHPIGAGMTNVGNTCYLNSTLQALFHVPAFVNWLLSDSHHTSKCEQQDNGGECLICAVTRTLEYSHRQSGHTIKPCQIYNKLKLICRTMVPGQQEDAHEFLRYLLEGMEKAYLTRFKANKLDSYSKETTPINQIFGGYIRTEVKCLQCQHVSTTFQHFQDLLVDIRNSSTLDEALSNYFSKEQLDNNDYKCGTCKKRVPATKQFSLERAPKVLCVQLKRFSVLGSKISRCIGFEQTIDIGPYLWREPGETSRKLVYKLMSMVTHVGTSVNCGHYTAVAQVSNGQYYCFDDSCVRLINLNHVLNTNAYIMIFEMEEPPKQTPPTTKLSCILATKNSSPTCKVSTSESVPLENAVNGSGNSKYDEDSSTIKTKDDKLTKGQGSARKMYNLAGSQEQLDKSNSKSHTCKRYGKLIQFIKSSSNKQKRLVPYDGSSEEDELTSESKIQSSSNHHPSKSRISPVSIPNGTTNSFPVKDTLSKSSPLNNDSRRSPTKSNGNGVSPQDHNSILPSNSNISDAPSLTTKQNGKSELHFKTDNNVKERWNSRIKSGQEDRVMTKASNNNNNNNNNINWQASAKHIDTSFAVSATTPNGWAVTETKDNNNKSDYHHNPTPSVADMRNFNGTNRSDTVSHLFKMSNRGYGNPSVSNWNGHKNHLDREVDNERREERKRRCNSDDEEIDRGRLKVRNLFHRNNNRSNGRYNVFQQYQNDKYWRRSCHPPHKRFYKTSNRSRPGGGVRRTPYHKYDNHSRSHWQRG